MCSALEPPPPSPQMADCVLSRRSINHENNTQDSLKFPDTGYWCVCHCGFMLTVQAKQCLLKARWRGAGSLWLHRLELIIVRPGKKKLIDFPMIKIRWINQISHPNITATSSTICTMTFSLHPPDFAPSILHFGRDWCGFVLSDCVIILCNQRQSQLLIHLFVIYCMMKSLSIFILVAVQHLSWFCSWQFL